MLYDIAPNIVAFSSERHTEDVDRPYAGFNVTPYTGDLPSRVDANQHRVCESLNIPPQHLIIPHQVHGTRVVEVTPLVLENPAPMLEGVDAVITSLTNVCIGVSTADCVPLLLYDQRTEAIGAVHAGWRGTVARIAVLTLARMYEAFGTRPEDVHCVIGPSIGPDVYEVGDDVYEAFHRAGFPMAQLTTRLPQSGAHAPRRWLLNLWESNAWQLQRAGVPAEQITISGICSYTSYYNFFSARRLGINSGRTFTAIMRRPKHGQSPE